MSPEEHYAKAEELLELAVNDEYPERHFQDRDWLTARAQAHATMALFTPAVSINVRNPKSADEIYRQRDEGARLARNPETLRRVKAALNSTTGDTIIPPAEEETKADPFKALHDVIAFSSMDWGASRDTAWIYGIICGWDNDDPIEGEELGSIDELAKRFRWDARAVAELRELRLQWLCREAASVPVSSLAETGPWQTVDEIQVGVPFEDKEGSELVKLADGKFGYLSYPRETPETLAKYAPFVAAEKEEA